MTYYRLYLTPTDVITKGTWNNHYDNNNAYIEYNDDVSQSIVIPYGYKAVEYI